MTETGHDALDDFFGTAGLPTARPVQQSSDEPEPERRPRGGPRRAAGERWVDLHARRTYHYPVDLLAEFDAAVTAADTSGSAAATEALRAWVKQQQRNRKTEERP